MVKKLLIIALALVLLAPMLGLVGVAVLMNPAAGTTCTVNPDGSANIIGVVSGTAFGVLLAVDGLLPLPAGLR